MKIRITFVLAVLLTSISFAQQGINYKALIKDDGGNVVASQNVDLQFIVYEGIALTNNVYQETHASVMTDANGIVIVNIGEGTTSDVFTDIDWGADDHYLNVQIDTGGGLTDMGTTGFKMVPYALHAKTADNFTSTIPYATGNGPNDGTDVGQIVSRVLNFTKKKANTKIRISYTDNLRTIGPNKSCRWQMRINGNACPSQDLVYDFFDASSGGNIHRSNTLVGYCDQVPDGPVQVQIWVLPTPGYSNCDCYTGFANSTWVIEAEEID